MAMQHPSHKEWQNQRLRREMEVCALNPSSVLPVKLPWILMLVLLASKPGRRGRAKKVVVEEAEPAEEEDQVKDVTNDCKIQLYTVDYTTNVQEADSDNTMKEEKSEESDEKATVKEEEV